VARIHDWQSDMLNYDHCAASCWCLARGLLSLVPRGAESSLDVGLSPSREPSPSLLNMNSQDGVVENGIYWLITGSFSYSSLSTLFTSLHLSHHSLPTAIPLSSPPLPSRHTTFTTPFRNALSVYLPCHWQYVPPRPGCKQTQTPWLTPTPDNCDWLQIPDQNSGSKWRCRYCGKTVYL
jgi:hypothetical protein